VPIAGKGRGVVAERDFAAGEIIEQAPVIVVPASDVEEICETHLDHFWYEWDDDGSCAIAGGCGSFYNHSFDPNVDFNKDFSGLTMIYVALRAIRAGEEITINYNGPGYLDPLHFEVR
jgi:SET domain-containing protein